jgi:hypothetical protein
MKGYFSHLAKQSGLRFSEQAGSASFPAGTEKTAPPPLHRDETVLVGPPPRPTGEPVSTGPQPPVNDTKIGMRSDGEIESPVKQTRALQDLQKKGDTAPDRRLNKPIEVEPGKKETVAVREESEVVSGATGPAELPAEEGQTVAVSPGELENPRGESRQKTAGPLAEERQTVTVTAGELENLQGESRQKAVEPGGGNPEKQIKYFTKTAELMGKEAPDSVRIREALFREVREWVADGPATADLRAPAQEIAVDTVAERYAPPGAVEQGIIAIEGKEPVERRETAERAEKDGVEEQSFNLSIGTISVIIESGDSPPPVNHTNQNTGRETRPTTSRLRRNYL